MKRLSVAGVVLLAALLASNVLGDKVLYCLDPPRVTFVIQDDASLSQGDPQQPPFALSFRLSWLWPRLPRWRFRAPQPASIRLVGLTPPSQRVATPAAPEAVQLTPLEKLTLIRESDEACYWCHRAFGSKVLLRGKPKRLRLHWDHVTPEHAGGVGDITNMVPSCHLCNSWKAAHIFPTEADIRAFLEERWTQELAAPVVEEPSPSANDLAVAAEDFARAHAPMALGKPSIAPREPPPEPEAAPPLRPIDIRRYPVGKEVRVATGSQKGSLGVAAGPSHTKPGWFRVLLGPQQVPWRFLPEQLTAP